MDMHDACSGVRTYGRMDGGGVVCEIAFTGIFLNLCKKDIC